MIIFIPFILSLSITLILYIISRKEELPVDRDEIDKKEYPLIDFLCIGFYLYKLIGEKKIMKINEEVYNKIVAIYGVEAKENFIIYEANKLLYSILILNGIYFIQAASGEFSIAILFIGIIGAIATFFIADTTIAKKFETRSLEIKYDFPEFLSKLVLLLGAGLTFENAFEKVVTENSNKSVLYKEMNKVYKNIQNGKPRDVSLKDMSRRCRVLSVTKFAGIVIQNISKGTSDMTMMLSNLSDECWNERKATARLKGEEASTKLLFPMMIMLIAIFLVVLVPAFMQMVSV